MIAQIATEILRTDTDKLTDNQPLDKYVISHLIRVIFQCQAIFYGVSMSSMSLKTLFLPKKRRVRKPR